ncbi:hypothetical protein WS95_23205 [Burkholderia sp. MSMB1826]|nr:hypothetical protein WS95_23205 [Burkholderia sp. MSMB1826]
MPNSTAALNVRWRNSDSGSIGVAVRDSIATNASAASAASTQPPATTGCVKPSGRHSITAPVSAVSIAIATNWPCRSSERGGAARSWRAGTHANVAASPAAESGRFTRKMPRQPHAAISRPPTTGPAAIAIDPAAVHAATARARRRGSCRHASFSSASEFGSMAAAPTPCSARAATSIAGATAAPHASDASANSRRPAIYRRRAPKRSPSAPADSISTANASVYASTTHCRPATGRCRSAARCASAMLTIVTSSCVTTKPMLTVATTRASAGGKAEEGVVVSMRPS